jgi:Holliday junction resolvasome RuvABC endonuclease subunit
MIISAIDYSITGPAICVFDTEKEFNFTNCSFYFLTDTKKYSTKFMNNIYGESFQSYNNECERYDYISNWALRVTAGSTRIAIEGYAYNATGRVFALAENTGILKYKLYKEQIPVDIIEPTKVKKLFTSKGNADKALMYTHFLQKTGINLQDIITPNKTLLGSPVTDIVDSYAICMALHSIL